MKKVNVKNNGVKITALTVLTVNVRKVMLYFVISFVMKKPVYLVHVMKTVYLVLTDLVKKITINIVLITVPNA